MTMVFSTQRLLLTLTGRAIPRNFRSRIERTYHEVSFAEPGNPNDVLGYLNNDNDDSLVDDKNDAVRVLVHHAPWNPADVNLVQGKYPSPYPPGQDRSMHNQSRFFPQRSVAGSEGYGRIVQVNNNNNNNNNSSDLSEGDWVTFANPGVGTLRSSLWLPSEAVLPIRRGSEVFDDNEGAAGVSTLFQLGGTALGMLRSFVELEPGDVVVQNAGNSGVGFVTSQLAKTMDVKVVSLIRRGKKTPEEFRALVQHLETAGKADVVLAQEDLIEDREAVRALKEDLKALGARPPILALNAVGGASSSVLMQLLGPGGIHVTYGGMSMRPVSVATSHLIFKDIHVRGYWHSRWMLEQKQQGTKVAMADELVDLYIEGKLRSPPVEVFSLSQVSEALQYASKQSEEKIRSKVVFDCREDITTV
jgi:trans-2-enoyl-CoA reductase